jgi:hypothetical protein
MTEHEDAPEIVEQEEDQEEVEVVPKKKGNTKGRPPGTKNRAAPSNSLAHKTEVVATIEDLHSLTLTRGQLKQIRMKHKAEEKQQKYEESEKLKAARAAANEKRKRVLDLRRSKEEEGIVLKIAPPRRCVRGKKQPTTEEEIEEAMKKRMPKIKDVVIEYSEEDLKEEEEAVTAEVERRVKNFQARKPKLEDEIAEKVDKLSKINNVLQQQSANPYLEMVMRNRMRPQS